MDCKTHESIGYQVEVFLEKDKGNKNYRDRDDRDEYKEDGDKEEKRAGNE
jgi:hypothetical protein